MIPVLRLCGYTRSTVSNIPVPLLDYTTATFYPILLPLFYPIPLPLFYPIPLPLFYPIPLPLF